MAKLNITANQIQSTTNMLTSTAPAADWDTDAKYPSANAVKTLVINTTNAIIEACENNSGSAEFPVGSVLMTHKELATGQTSAVANPATLLGLPGTWTLIDKTFKSGISAIGGPGNEFSQATNGFSLSVENAIRQDHLLSLQLGIYVADATDKSVQSGQSSLTMANLNLSRYGVYGLSYAPINGIAFATNSSSSTSSSAICYGFQGGGGTLVLYDVFNGGTSAHTLSKTAHMYLNITIPVPHGDMIDSFCDKFYWKRTE